MFILTPPPKKQLIGHRGASAFAPENTFAAFKLAADYGLNWVEFDTQRCGSGEWLVIHDESLERTTNGQGFISKMSYEQIKLLKVSQDSNVDMGEQSVPLLSETLEYLGKLRIQPNIEMKHNTKTHQENLEETCQSFFQILARHWPDNLPPPLISSFDLNTLICLKKLRPNLLLGYIVEHIQEDTLVILKKYAFSSLHCAEEYLKRNQLVTFFNQGIPILAYTVNSPKRARELLSMGVSALFSDYPNLI